MSTMKVYIASSREIGERCKTYAKENMPEGYSLTNIIDECNIFISIMYDTLVSKSFLNNRRCYNFHPGILPYYRGSGAFSWAIINDEKLTGITLHEIDEGIDTGPIISIKDFEIAKNSTAFDLFIKGMECIFELFVEKFECILKNNYTIQKSTETKLPLYTKKNMDQLKDITKFVRALTFPNKEGVYYYIDNGKKIYLEPFKRY